MQSVHLWIEDSESRDSLEVNTESIIENLNKSSEIMKEMLNLYMGDQLESFPPTYVMIVKNINSYIEDIRLKLSEALIASDELSRDQSVFRKN